MTISKYTAIKNPHSTIQCLTKNAIIFSLEMWTNYNNVAHSREIPINNLQENYIKIVHAFHTDYVSQIIQVINDDKHFF